MKNTKFNIPFIFAAIVVPCILTSCNSVTVDSLIVPTYSSNKRINIGAWSWTAKGLTQTQLRDIQDAGMNLMIGTFNGSNDSADAGLLNSAKDYDIGFILDKRNWDGNAPTYLNNENFLGYCVSDEPDMSHANSIKALKEKWDASELKDKLFYVNLHPCYTTRVNDYEGYIKYYTEDIGLDMVSTDYYAMYEDSNDCGVGIREDWLLDLSLTAHYSLINNVPMWFTLLTTKHQASGLNYINPDARDLEYQMYVALAFGAQYLIHYTYAATGPDHINPIIDSKGQPTDSYYDVKESSATIRKWDKFYMDFKWVGSTGVYGNHSINSLIDYMYYEAPLNATGAIKQASSSQDVVIGQFEDKDNNKGFVITNLTNPYLEKTAKTTLKFDSKYKGVKVYQDGEEQVLLLNKGTIDLNIKPGQGIFVIPLEAK